MALKMREGYVPPPVSTPQEQIRYKLEHSSQIHITDNLKRWLMVGSYSIAPDRIEIGRHGLIVSNGERRGLLLPQVGQEFGWAAERFLEETCVKGGLDRDAWKDPATRVQAFTADVFAESSLKAEEQVAPVPPSPGYSSST